MPVVNPAGSLIGKVTQATSDRAQVMLLTDTNYAVLVKIVRPEPLPDGRHDDHDPGGPWGRRHRSQRDDVDDSHVHDVDDVPPTTTTLPDPQRGTGQMVGRGVDELPQVELIDDSPAFGTPEVGDTVLTAGGDRSLAPADIPIGVVSDVRHGSPSEGGSSTSSRSPSWRVSSSSR